MILSTLASAALGLLGSLVPELVDIYKGKQQRKQAIELVQLEKSGLRAQQVIDTQLQLSKDAEAPIGNWFADGVYKLTRPYITGLVILMWGAVNVIEMSLLLDALDWKAVPMAWDAEDQSITTIVVTFWFGHRAMQRRVR